MGVVIISSIVAFTAIILLLVLILLYAQAKLVQVFQEIVEQLSFQAQCEIIPPIPVDLPCFQPLLRVFVALAGTDSVSVETCLFEYPVEPSHDQQVVVFRCNDENRGVSGSCIVKGRSGVGEQSSICTCTQKCLLKSFYPRKRVTLQRFHFYLVRKKPIPAPWS